MVFPAISNTESGRTKDITLHNLQTLLQTKTGFFLNFREGCISCRSLALYIVVSFCRQLSAIRWTVWNCWLVPGLTSRWRTGRETRVYIMLLETNSIMWWWSCWYLQDDNGC